MISALFALLSIFPVSFFAFALSQRLIAKHESRVGRSILFLDFLWQTWLDSWVELKEIVPRWRWAVYALQFSIIFLFNYDLEYLVFAYLALNGFVLAHLGKVVSSPTQQIEADRLQVRFSIATGIAALCVFGCFTISKSTSLAQVHWSWLDLFFIIPFQLSGMILFGEHPFEGMSHRTGWVESARFYAWSMLGTKLFLGGGVFFFDLHLKSIVIYLVFRVFGIYFPTFHQRDLLRIGILYLFPITALLWLVAMLAFGMIQAGGAHV